MPNSYVVPQMRDLLRTEVWFGLLEKVQES